MVQPTGALYICRLAVVWALWAHGRLAEPTLHYWLPATCPACAAPPSVRSLYLS